MSKCQFILAVQNYKEIYNLQIFLSMKSSEFTLKYVFFLTNFKRDTYVFVL